MPTKNIVDTDSRAVLANRLSKPIKTPADVKEVQRMIGLVLLNNGNDIVNMRSDIIDLVHTIRGSNGNVGLISRVEAISKEVEQMKKVREDKKERPKINAWLADKVAPNVVSALTVWVFTIIAIVIVLEFSPILQEMAKHAAGIP